MKIIKVENPVYARADNAAIDCTVTFDDEQVCPYTATAHDKMLYGAQLWRDLNAGVYGPIMAYQPPAE